MDGAQTFRPDQGSSFSFPATAVALSSGFPPGGSRGGRGEGALGAAPSYLAVRRRYRTKRPTTINNGNGQRSGHADGNPGILGEIRRRSWQPVRRWRRRGGLRHHDLDNVILELDRLRGSDGRGDLGRPPALYGD